jgi:uncharacterized protein (DUF2344 family)
MLKFVVTVQDDVCRANGKDPNATELLKGAATYGKVEMYDDCVAEVKKEYQKIIDNLGALNEAIKEQNLTAEEIAIVNAYRTQRAIAVKGYIEENEKLTQTLEEVKTEHERTIEIIANVINKK